MLAIIKELVQLGALNLTLVQIIGKVACGSSAHFLHLLELLEQNLFLHIIGFFEDLGTQIR